MPSRLKLSAFLLGMAVTTSCGGAADVTAEVLAPVSCSNPVAVTGTTSPTAPGYIVTFNDGVNSETESPRLAAKYAFVTRFVYVSVLSGFAAELTPTQVAGLRCEASVKAIAHNG